MAENVDGRVETLQRLALIGPCTLNEIFGLLRGHEDALGANCEEIDAALHSTVSRCIRKDQLERKGGGHVEITWLDPMRLTMVMLERSETLQDVYAAAALKHPPTLESPWSIVLGFDEYLIGNKFGGTKNLRKVMNAAFNFKEIGPLINRDPTWMTPMILRKSVINSVRGGWPCVMRLVIRHMAIDALSFSNAGVPIFTKAGDFMLHARLTNVLADGDGIRMAYIVKGGSSIKACCQCNNVLRKNSSLAHLRPGFVEICCGNYSQLELATERCYNNLVDQCAKVHADFESGACGKPQLQTAQISRGITYEPNSWVEDEDVRNSVGTLRLLTDDWVHVFLQDGTVIAEIKCLLRAMRPMLQRNAMENFLKCDWRYPRQHTKAGKLHHVFRAACESGDAMKLKAGASEVLALYILLRHFVEMKEDAIVRNGLTAEIRSFYALCEVIDKIMSIKRCISDARRCRAALIASTEAHLQRHVEAYGNDAIRPKHHKEMHLPDQFGRDGCVLDGFIIERLNNDLRRISEKVANTRRFEDTLLSMTACQRLHMLAKHEYGDRLIGKRAEHPDFDGATFAPRMEYKTAVFSAGDIVSCDGALGCIKACAEEGGSLYAFVVVFEQVERLTKHSVRAAHLQERTEVWPADRLVDVAAWYFDRAGAVVIHYGSL